jgi:uncharacterized protein (TIGR02246 family)
MTTYGMSNNNTTEEAAIRMLVENWAGAVRSKNINGILAHHAPDILMFDVPPPLVSRGIEEYQKTWDLFYDFADDPVTFDIVEMNVTAGDEVAFVSALMKCMTREKDGSFSHLDFRLTLGLRKVEGQWTIIHEHHSIPAI